LNWRELARGLGDVFFPPVCVHCRGLVEGGPYRHLCPRCARLLAFIRDPCCPVCGHPLGAAETGDRNCAGCAGLDPAFGAARAAVRFGGPARSLLLELKYRRGRHVACDLEEIFRRSRPVLDHVRDAALVPVPLHPRRSRERGYNQSALLAAALARAAGGRTRVAPLLRRVRDTPTQTALDRRDREANLRGAFALARGARPDPDQRYVLVDDVFTTGSTLNGCARALRRSGCLHLDVAAFGHG
jgi:ComF family protein